MSSSNPKKELFAQFAQVAKALSNGHRLELLEFLAQGERSVEALAEISDLSIANTSQHLQRLRQAGLVTSRMDGHKVLYRLADEADTVELLAVLRRVAERSLGEVERLVRSYLHTKDEFEPIPAIDLLSRARSGAVTVLDVRPPEEFAAGHLQGAVNIPLKDLESRLSQLPKNKEIVAYCRGPYCVLAFEAVARLRDKGFQARRLSDGYPEWRLAGYPVERG